MNVFYDTEFLERGPKYPIELISVGMVNDRGEEVYVINKDAPLDDIAKHSWLKDNVLPYLPVRMVLDNENNLSWDWDENHPEYEYVFPRDEVRDRIFGFLIRDRDVKLWAWYGAYDHVCLAQLWNTMAELPDQVPMWTNDIRQELEYAPKTKLPLPSKWQEHRAINDARWNKKVYDYINQSLP